MATQARHPPIHDSAWCCYPVQADAESSWRSGALVSEWMRCWTRLPGSGQGRCGSRCSRATGSAWWTGRRCGRGRSCAPGWARRWGGTGRERPAGGSGCGCSTRAGAQRGAWGQGRGCSPGGRQRGAPCRGPPNSPVSCHARVLYIDRRARPGRILQTGSQRSGRAVLGSPCWSARFRRQSDGPARPAPPRPPSCPAWAPRCASWRRPQVGPPRRRATPGES